ncbi:MAG: EAL domain-containing protein [Betaproteobacteria bacterium]|nr:EAL domain-containing protein [Betaproteobacteria bacterium]
MTLGRQLIAGITGAFIALLLGIETIYVFNARDSLEKQLDAHANETATSLALSLGARVATLDASLVNIMVNPVFDRGHFESIEVSAPNGERVFGRRLEGPEIDVPRWFVVLVPLEGPRGEALISSGWRQLGKVAVRVHPQYAYRQLFDTALATLAWLALLFALALAAMRSYLAGILRPLHRIEQAAVAISNRDFVHIDTEPRTSELQQVTRAINSLSAKIREAIAQEADRAERLRKEAFEDPLTGQMNRRGFEQSVSAFLAETGEIHSGALALFALSGLEEVNRIFGLSRGNEIVKKLADTLGVPGTQRSAIVGRWQGPTLVAFVPNAEPASAVAWADGICKVFADQLRADGLPASTTVSSGVAHFSARQVSLMQLAVSAEGALADVARIGGSAVSAPRTGGQSPATNLQQEIEKAIAGNRIALLGQKVFSIPGNDVLQMEILSSLTGSDGKAIAAGSFVPVASQHGLLPLLDQKVIEQAVAAMGRIASLPRAISVNVSMQSISNAGFRSALRDLLTSDRHAAGRLVFEVTGYAASRSPELTRGFSDELHGLGAGVALDNFDLDRNSMATVHRLLPAHIKLAPAFTQQIAAREDLRFIVEAMVRMLRPLEIPLIAQSVEDPSTVAILAELGLAAYQGYAGGRPAPLDTA